MSNVEDYKVYFKIEDGDVIAYVREFPSLSWIADEPGAAIAGMKAVLAGVLAEMHVSGETPPAAIKETEQERLLRAEAHRLSELPLDFSSPAWVSD